MSVQDMQEIKRLIYEAQTDPATFKAYYLRLPLAADVVMYCQHLNDNGDRCTQYATDIYTHHCDPVLDDGWYCVYVCREHLAKVMHVRVEEQRP